MTRLLPALLLIFSLSSIPASGREISREFREESAGWMERSVRFWTRIFTEYTSKQAVLHDAKYPDIVYEVVENNSATVRRAMEKWREALLEASRSGGADAGLSHDARVVKDLYRGIEEPDPLARAAHRKRLRAQRGHKESFIEAYVASGRTLPKFEEIFIARGVPWEITRIPFIESGFRGDARSSTGALGIWQFMEATARLYLRVTPALDERRDPYFAADAAARLFRDNFEALGNWPLAVTAYNHGRRNLMRATRQVGTTDLGDLVRSNRARNFGFAGKNYFAELVAVLAIERDAEKLLPGVKREDADRFVDLVLPASVSFPSVARALGVKVKDLARRNPAVLPAGVAGRARLPVGAHIHVDFREGESEKAALARVAKAKEALLSRLGASSRVQSR